MINSRQKGARRERMIAADVAQHLGIRCERAAQNGKSKQDLEHDMRGVHLEAKGPARCAAFTYLHQAEHDCGSAVPVVLIRPDREETAVLVRLADLPELSRRVVAALDEGAA